MKKEVILAITIGILLGFGLMGIIWVKNQSGQSLFSGSQKNEVKSEDIAPSPPSDKEITTKPVAAEPTLEILEPKNEAVVNKENLVIKGKTNPLATVVVIWEEGEDILVADDNGLFETEISLVGGPNEVEITAYSQEGEEAKEILIVTYSTAKF